MRATIALAIALGFATLGCTSDPEVQREQRAFTAAQKAGCPAHPFKTEFQHIQKAGAGSAVDLDVQVYDYQGYLVRSFLIQNISSPDFPGLRSLWDFKDENGKEIRSGYYFWAITEMESGEERVQCTFYVNTADQDKMR